MTRYIVTPGKYALNIPFIALCADNTILRNSHTGMSNVALCQLILTTDVRT